jgi:hypothetical protein
LKKAKNPSKGIKASRSSVTVQLKEKTREDGKKTEQAATTNPQRALQTAFEEEHFTDRP